MRVVVKDTGCGIDPEILPRLFTKFTTKSNKGTGLGLFISKNIVEAHGGKIWGENNPKGKGAVFVFTLPRVNDRKVVAECLSAHGLKADRQHRSIRNKQYDGDLQVT
jgi:signal transduction histidine kinase